MIGTHLGLRAGTGNLQNIVEIVMCIDEARLLLASLNLARDLPRQLGIYADPYDNLRTLLVDALLHEDKKHPLDRRL